MEEVKLPEKVNDIYGNTVYLDGILGQGGQGLVCRTKDRNLAVKFLVRDGKIIENEAMYCNFQDKIEEVTILRLDDDIHVCKPEVMLEKPMCGYIMKLLNKLQPVSHLIYNNEKEFETFYLETFSLKKRLEVLLELSRTLARIHSKGMVYCDISPNNVFYSPSEPFSKVWLIDCDNLRTLNSKGSTIYTPGYGAPEVVKNISNNTVYSDCFSFSVLAFRILTSKNPFALQSYSDASSDGWDASTVKEVTNIDANDTPWICDQDAKGYDPNIMEYIKHFVTKEMFELFNETFSELGRNAPYSRPSMRRWYDVLKNAYKLLQKCECGNYYFVFNPACAFCNQETIIDSYASVYLQNNKEHIKNAIDHVQKHFDNDDIDIEDHKQIYSKLENMKLYDIAIYDGLSIFNFNYDDISIMDEPNELIHFEMVNNRMIVSNVSDRKFVFYYNNQALPTYSECKLNKGEQLIVIDKESKYGITKIIVIRYL